MNTKKTWIYAILFGLTMSLLMLIIMRPDEEPAEDDLNETEQSDGNVTVDLENEHTNQESTNNENKDFFKVEKGKRAVSIFVNEVQGISGFLQPGDYVDVVVVVPPPEGENSSSQILLQNIKVLASGKKFIAETKNGEDAVKKADETTGDQDTGQQEVNRESEVESEAPLEYQTVTLEVLPQEGAALIFAAEKGFVSLMLREKDDKGDSPHVHITLDQINKGMIPE